MVSRFLDWKDALILVFDGIGAFLIKLILECAALVTGGNLPGLVSAAFLAVLAVLCVWHRATTWRFCSAVRAARSALRNGNGPITHERLIDIDRRFKELEKKKGPRHRLGTAWEEFRETTVNPARENDSLHNTVRPMVFFDREELGLERGWWRQVPPLFISFGLFLTFLGLVAALDQTGRILDNASTGDEGVTTEGLKTLLRIAGAKFIMSLTGLLCSIVFTVWLRLAARRTDGALHELCTDIENGCQFLSQQIVLREMLDQARQQTDHLKTFGTELVAQVARPLREDLPAAIRTALAGSSNEATRAFNEAAETMLREMTEALRSIRDTSADSARKIGEASQTMVHAALAGGREIERAGQGMATGIDAATATMRDSLLNPMDKLVEKVQNLASGVDVAAGRIERYAESVDASATAVTLANTELGRSTETLVSATAPVQEAVSNMEATGRTMGDRVEAAAETMARTTEHTESIMRGAREAIEASQATVQQGLGSLEHAVAEFSDVVERYREIDRSLGDAFRKIETAVHDNVREIQTFTRELNAEFGRALNRLESVIAQSEPFEPRQDA